MSDLVEKVRAAIDAAPWVERRDSFGTMHDTRAEARAAIAAVAEWVYATGYTESEYWAEVLRAAAGSAPTTPEVK